MAPDRQGVVDDKPARQWSPGSGRLRLEGGFVVNRIYRRKWADKEASGKAFRHLHGKKRNSRAKGQAGRAVAGGPCLQIHVAGPASGPICDRIAFSESASPFPKAPASWGISATGKTDIPSSSA